MAVGSLAAYRRTAGSSRHSSAEHRRTRDTASDHQHVLRPHRRNDMLKSKEVRSVGSLHVRAFHHAFRQQHSHAAHWSRGVGNNILISSRQQQQQQQQRALRMSSTPGALPESTTTEIAGIGGPGPFGGRGGGTVNGSVAAGWHDLREAFECNFAKNMELGAQLVVYKSGTVSCVSEHAFCVRARE
eukprot:SAG31_NODE_543_length_14248_cov_3.230900_1_plen_186_part_00